MIARRSSVLGALALLAGLPLAAVAQPAPSPERAALAAATNDYFAATAHADPAAISRSTTSSFRLTGSDGKPLDQATYLGDLITRHLNASTPVQSVRIGSTTIAGTTATESVDVSSYDNLLLGERSWLERDTSIHVLTFVQSAGGTWLVSEDRITSATHLI